MWRSINEGLFEVVKLFASVGFMRELVQNDAVHVEDNCDNHLFVQYPVLYGAKAM